MKSHLLEADVGAVLAAPSPDKVVVTIICILPTLHVNNFVTSTASRKLIHFVRHGYDNTQHTRYTIDYSSGGNCGLFMTIVLHLLVAKYGAGEN